MHWWNAVAIGSGCLNCLVSSDHTKGLIYAIFARHLRKLEDISSWALQMYVLFNVMCFLFLGAPKTKNIYIFFFTLIYFDSKLQVHKLPPNGTLWAILYPTVLSTVSGRICKSHMLCEWLVPQHDSILFYARGQPRFGTVGERISDIYPGWLRPTGSLDHELFWWINLVFLLRHGRSHTRCNCVAQPLPHHSLRWSRFHPVCQAGLAHPQVQCMVPWQWHPAAWLCVQPQTTGKMHKYVFWKKNGWNMISFV